MINQAARVAGAEEGGRRAQILDAAVQVMAERGFRGASIKRIAERAGLKSPALIYWYFKDKQALFEAMLEQMAPFLAVVADAENLLDQPPEQVLPRIVDGFLRTVQQPVIGRFVRILLAPFLVVWPVAFANRSSRERRRGGERYRRGAPPGCR